MSDVEFYYNNMQFLGVIPLREISVDYTKDTNSDKPIPSIHEIVMKNNTSNKLTEIMVATNLPEGTYDIMQVPRSIPPDSGRPIKLAIYGRRIFEMSDQVPKNVQLDVVYKEVLQRT